MLTQVINSKRSDVLTIEYMLGNLCNYKCSYCFPGSNEGNYKWPNTDIVIKHLDHLLQTYIKFGKTRFEFYFIGGEPTLWKDLPKLCKHLKAHYDVKLRISTNGSRPLDFWKNYSKCFDQIEVSVHHEFAKPDHIKQVCDIIYDQKINLVANVLMNPDAFDKCKDIVEELKTSYRKWPILAKVVHFKGQPRYTEEQQKYFSHTLKRYPNLFWYWRIKDRETIKIWKIEDDKKQRVNSSWFVFNNANHFKGWTCNLGVDHLSIYQDGRISGNCQQLIYGLPLFNFYDADFIEKFNPEIKPTVCSKNTCECTHEITINKRL